MRSSKISGFCAPLRRAAAHIVLALLVAAAPGVGVANDLGAFLGRWDAASPDCSYPQGDGVFVVERRALRFFESICDIDSVRSPGVGRALTARMTCEGEGETWSEDLFLARTEDDKLIVYYGSGYGFIAGRCRR